MDVTGLHLWIMGVRADGLSDRVRYGMAKEQAEGTAIPFAFFHLPELLKRKGGTREWERKWKEGRKSYQKPDGVWHSNPLLLTQFSSTTRKHPRTITLPSSPTVYYPASTRTLQFFDLRKLPIIFRVMHARSHLCLLPFASYEPPPSILFPGETSLFIRRRIQS